MKTIELIGPALDWAVSKCEGRSELELLENFKVAWFTWGNTHYSTDWAHGGPIIDRACIFIAPTWDGENAGSSARSSRTAWIEGPTPLIAAMRCYVASKMGDDIEVPEGLL